MDSAIYYQGGIAEEPSRLSVATGRTDRSSLKMGFSIKRHYFPCNNFETGVRKKNTEFGSYNIYDIERSICDIVRLGQETDIKITDLVRSNGRQYERILKYAELFRAKQLIETAVNLSGTCG